LSGYVYDVATGAEIATAQACGQADGDWEKVMKFETTIEADYVTLRVVGQHCPEEIEPHGEIAPEGFDDVEVWLCGQGGKETDITSAITETQYDDIYAVLMQEWRNR